MLTIVFAAGMKAVAPTVSVIVPALNAARTLGETLDALAAQDLAEEYEVIVVDNGSDDATRQVAGASRAPVRVLRQARDRAGSARNRGASAAASPILAFTDADCRPAPGWLRAGLEAMRDADLVQGAVRPDSRVSSLPFDRSLWVTGEHGLYETANLFVDRELFLSIGGFEDWIEADVSVPFGEDVWLGWRARRAGASTRFCEEAVVYHAVFRRGWKAYVGERRRTRYFPALAARIPELRRSFLYGRLFLSARSAALDLALAGGIAAVVAGTPIPLVAAAPYAWQSSRAALPWRRHAPKVAAVELVADLVSLGSLALGSIRYRSPVI